MGFPNVRLRRLRRSLGLRRLVQETVLSPADFVMPLFVRPGKNVRKPIAALPGQFQLSVDQAAKEAAEAEGLGIPAVILFGIPEKKDAQGSEAFARGGIVQTAIRAIKDKAPGMVVISDLCFCEYTDHGHCGVVRGGKEGGVRPAKRGAAPFVLDNDATLDLLAKTALSQAEAGADVIAPSGMIDGMVRAIRSALDGGGCEDRAILAYSAKYASAFYGPFREAVESRPQFGDRKTYQMAPGNSDEALREAALDIEEGADIVMVKPALPYLDVIRRVKENFDAPVAAFNVSGEYAMVKAAAERGWIDEPQTVLETLTGIKRAGAKVILTYHAKDAARWLSR